jgi:hypothetical protein
MIPGLALLGLLAGGCFTSAIASHKGHRSGWFFVLGFMWPLLGLPFAATIAPQYAGRGRA